MTARRIGLVAWHVFKESVRDRVLYGIGGVRACCWSPRRFAIGQITAGQDVKIIKDLGLATIELAGVLMTVFIGVGLVAREIDRRSIFGLLAKPLPRWEFIVGKYLGLVLTIVVNVCGDDGGALPDARLAATGSRRASVRVAWDAPALDPRLLARGRADRRRARAADGVALFFSTFSSSALLSVVVHRRASSWPACSAPDLRRLRRHRRGAAGWCRASSPPSAGSCRRSRRSTSRPTSSTGCRCRPAFVLSTLRLRRRATSATPGRRAVAVFSRREFK